MGLVQIHYIVIIVESLLYDNHFLHYYFSFVEPFHEVNFYMLAFNFEINCLHPRVIATNVICYPVTMMILFPFFCTDLFSGSFLFEIRTEAIKFIVLTSH